MKTKRDWENEVRRSVIAPMLKAVAGVGLLLGAGMVCAADASDWVSETASFTPLPLAANPTVGAGTTGTPTSRIEITTSNLPRFDNLEGSNRTQRRLDMALLSPGRSSFGVTMGISGLSPSRASFGPGAVPEVTGVNLGLQWRYILNSNRRIDITAWRDVGRPNDALSLIRSQDAGYGARVEMQISGRGMPLVAERGFIGVQLDGGARISVKRSAGRPMVYYRNKF